MDNIFKAVEKGDLARVKELIAAGINVNKINDNDYRQTPFNNTLLHDVATSDDPELVQLYLDKGLDVNTTDDFNRTPLHEAAKSNTNPEVITLLLKKGAKKEVKDSINRTPLHESSRYNIPEISKALVEAGADLGTTFNDNGKAPIHLAAWVSKSPVELILLFLEHGDDINAKDDKGNTPLHYIYEFQKTDITQDLIDLGADVKAVNNQGNTPLHILAQYSNSRSKDIIRTATMTLLKNGANIDTRNAEGKTPAEISPNIKGLIEEYSNYKKEGENLQEIVSKDKNLEDETMKVFETVILNHYDTPQKFDAMTSPTNEDKKQDNKSGSAEKHEKGNPKKKKHP